MILIYSDQCKHCNILLETINKHDKNNIVRKISVDYFRNNNYNIDNIIHSVPALIPILHDNGKKIKTDEILYGKQVFDYLLIPNRGALFSQNNNTRLNKDIKDSKQNDTFTNNNENNIDEPFAFSLGSTMSENFASIDDNDSKLLNDKSYKWDLLNNIDNTNNINNTNIDNTSITPISSSNEGNKLPSIEELLNKRNQEII